MKRRFCLLAALPLALGACAGDDTGDMETAEFPGADAPAMDGTMDGAMDAGMDGQMGTMASTVTLSPLAESGISGEAIVTPAGAESEVSVTLTGLEADASHPGHIHQGTCDAVGSVVVPLTAITGDASGSGTMTTTVAVSAESVMAGNHIVVYHSPSGTPAVCGEIEGHMM